MHSHLWHFLNAHQLWTERKTFPVIFVEADMQSWYTLLFFCSYAHNWEISMNEWLAEMYKGQQDFSRGMFCCKMNQLFYFRFVLGNTEAGKNKRHIQVWWFAWVKSSWRQQHAILNLPDPRRAWDILRCKLPCYNCPPLTVSEREVFQKEFCWGLLWRTVWGFGCSADWHAVRGPLQDTALSSGETFAHPLQRL